VIRRTVRADDPLEQVRESVGGVRRDDHEHERLPAPLRERDDGGEHDPDERVRADAREPDEDVVERFPAMPDDPVLDGAVEGGQTGTMDFVWSISCCRSNGLPTKPCAPPACACSTASSSTFPLNITTGIAPAPYCSWTRRSISQPSTWGIITSRRMRS